MRQGVDDLLRVGVSLDRIEYFLHDTLLINDEGDPSGHVGFLVQNSIGLRDAFVGIRDQLKWQAELLCEVLVG